MLTSAEAYIYTVCDDDKTLQSLHPFHITLCLALSLELYICKEGILRPLLSVQNLQRHPQPGGAIAAIARGCRNMSKLTAACSWAAHIWHFKVSQKSGIYAEHPAMISELQGLSRLSMLGMTASDCGAQWSQSCVASMTMQAAKWSA